MKISIIGPPGSGKTTQAQMLSTTSNTMHISSGDLVRRHLVDEHTTTELAKGNLAPNEEAVRNLVRNAIAHTESYVLDGFPRMIDQIEDVRVPLDVVVYLDITRFAVIKRLLDRGRPDDT
ncbi:MAG: nucleoside monophosphate kinase, partial [Planctomycetes bacterium]|nr:nucleoside monophosphate kinase [Planctomycetota bacterium]